MNHSLPFIPRQRHPLNKGALGKKKSRMIGKMITVDAAISSAHSVPAWLKKPFMPRANV